MANTFINLDTGFQPFSYQELLAPVLAATEADNKLTEDVTNLDTLTQQADALITAHSDDLGLRTRYEGYKAELDAAAEEILKNGYSLKTKNMFNKLKARFASEIDPIVTAGKRRLDFSQKIAEQRALNPDLVVEGDQFSTKSFMDGTPVPVSQNLKTVEADAADTAKIASARIVNAGEWNTILGNQYFERVTKTGINPEDVSKFLNEIKAIEAKDPKERTLAESTLLDVYNSSLARANHGAFTQDTNKQLIEAAVIQGIAKGVVYTEKSDTQSNKEYMSPKERLAMVHAANQDKRASEKHTKEMAILQKQLDKLNNPQDPPKDTTEDTDTMKSTARNSTRTVSDRSKRQVDNTAEEFTAMKNRNDGAASKNTPPPTTKELVNFLFSYTTTNHPEVGYTKASLKSYFKPSESLKESLSAMYEYLDSDAFYSINNRAGERRYVGPITLKNAIANAISQLDNETLDALNIDRILNSASNINSLVNSANLDVETREALQRMASDVSSESSKFETNIHDTAVKLLNNAKRHVDNFSKYNIITGYDITFLPTSEQLSTLQSTLSGAIAKANADLTLKKVNANGEAVPISESLGEINKGSLLGWGINTTRNGITFIYKDGIYELELPELSSEIEKIHNIQNFVVKPSLSSSMSSKGIDYNTANTLMAEALNKDNFGIINTSLNSSILSTRGDGTIIVDKNNPNVIPINGDTYGISIPVYSSVDSTGTKAPDDVIKVVFKVSGNTIIPGSVTVMSENDATSFQDGSNELTTLLSDEFIKYVSALGNKKS